GKAVVVEVLQAQRLVKEQTEVEVFVELPDPVQGLAMTDDVDDESHDAGAGRELPLLLVPFDHAVDVVGNAKVPADLSDESGGPDHLRTDVREPHVEKAPS